MVDAPYAIRKMNLSCKSRRRIVFFGVLSMVDAPYAIRETDLNWIAAGLCFGVFVNGKRAICYL